MLFREEFQRKATEILLKRHQDKNWLKDKSNVIVNKFRIPMSHIDDVLFLTKPLEICDEYTLYIICDSLDELDPSDYFSEKEIKYFNNRMPTKEKLKFPIVFKMIQVREDQWIGRIKVSELIRFGDAQIIHYNENTQRTFDRVVRGGTEYYKISVNKKAINEIRKSFKDNSYIPNTITFNMPPTTEFDYDPSTCELTIDSLEYFDILDGYHRYVALTEIAHFDEEFDYEMELRIVSFSEETAKQFIFQEDQKTPMKKIDSMSFNQNDDGNKVVNMINTDQKFILKGKVSTKSDQIINAPELSLFINGVMIRESNVKTSQLLSYKNQLISYFNKIIQAHPELKEERWSKYLLLSLVFGCKCNVSNWEKINNLAKYFKSEKSQTISQNRITKALFDEAVNNLTK